MAADSAQIVDAVRKQLEPIVLVILDGWGLSAGVSGNVIRQAQPDQFVRLWHEHPHGVLRAVSPVDEAMGMLGSSVTGHASIGTGRLVHADASDLQLAIASGAFFTSSGFAELVAVSQANRRTVHVISLISDRSSHGRTDIVTACLELLQRQQLTDVVLHVILDDAPGAAVAQTLRQLAAALAHRSLARIGSVSGRSFALDRSEQWELTRRTYRALIGRPGRSCTLEQLLDELTEQIDQAGDLEPTTVIDAAAQPVGVVRAGDTVLVTTTRADRSIQLIRAFADPQALTRLGLVRREPLLGVKLWTLIDCHLDLPDVLPVFRTAAIPDSLGRIVADHGLAQARIAPTNRFSHVTFSLNGGHSEPFDHEVRLAAEDSDQLATVATATIRARQSPFIVINLPAADQAAHTGRTEETLAAVRSVDAALGAIAEATLTAGGALVVTADHGNAESLLPSRAGAHHTRNGVPWIVATVENRRPTRVSPSRLTFPSGLPDHHRTLADIAPTVLALLGIAKPSTMTGRSLVSPYGTAR